MLSWVLLAFMGTVSSVAWGDAKEGMPDLSQVDNTCLPTSTAQLLIWFSKHGYPNLLPSGSSEDERNLGVVHRLMMDTNASFDWGTQFDRISTGIIQYVHSAGYGCQVDYRGLGSAPFSQDWLNENNDPNKGFILLLQYVKNDANDTFSNALNMGHAVTLVSYDSESMVIEDTAHLDSEPGRKIILSTPLSHGVLVEQGQNIPVGGLMLLSGSLLEAPPDSMVMLTGALRITMYSSLADEIKGDKPVQSSGSLNTQAPVDKTWLDWLFSWIFSS